jgi:putative transposase
MRYHPAFLKRKRVSDFSVGIDFGVVHLLSMSSGEVVDNPRHIDRAKKRLTKLQRNLSRKKKRSENHKRAARRVARQHERVANRRNDFLHKLSNRIVRENKFIAVEELKIKNMTRSAKGTQEEPGKKVKQKSGLNRALLDASPSRLYSMITYKAEDAGSVIVKVPAPYTSQSCSACGNVDKNNRKSQAEFVCTKCGHTENADINAAKNILAAGMAATACGGTSVPMKQEPCARVGSSYRKRGSVKPTTNGGEA